MLKTDEINIEYLQTLLNEIIKTHSFKQVHSPIVKTKLTKNEKIKFAQILSFINNYVPNFAIF